MNVFRIRSLLLVVLAFLGVGTAVTAQPMPVAGSSRAKANAGTVGIISGGVDGTYVRIAADLAAVLDDGQTLRVLPVIGKGSLQSVADILYLRGIDVGIVQSDVLAYVRQQHLYPGVEQSLQYVAKLYDEEVHVLARKDIARVEDLAGQPVNVDVVGSGTAMTAPLIFDALGVAVQIKNFDQSSALERLKQGELAAIVYVSGQPARLFADVTQESGLHFLALPLTNGLAATYLPAGLDSPILPGAGSGWRAREHRRRGLGDGGVRVAAKQRALRQAQPVHRRGLYQVSRATEATATPKMERRQFGGQGAGLDAVRSRSGCLGEAGHVAQRHRYPQRDRQPAQIVRRVCRGARRVHALNDAQMAVMFWHFLDWQDRMGLQASPCGKPRPGRCPRFSIAGLAGD